MVLVIADPRGGAVVALSYASRVDHGQLRDAIGRLTARTKGRFSGLAIEDKPLETHSRALATAAEFSAEGLLAPRGGALPLVPILDSLPGWRHLRAVFVVPQGFVFAGPETIETPGLTLRLLKGRDVYEYDVVRISGGAAPPGAAARASRSAPRQIRGQRGWGVGLAVVLPVAAVALAWLLWGRRMPRKP
jgi:hypothetical protein